MARRTRLTDAGIARLRPGRRDRTVWDTVTPGLGVRVRASGFRGYVFHQRGPGGGRRVSLGPAALKTVTEARRACLAIQLDGGVAGSGTGPGSGDGIPGFRDYVAGPWMAGHRHRWKPSTLRTVRSLLRCQLLPAFGHLRLDRIAPADVDAWFDRRSATAPRAAWSPRTPRGARG